MKNSTRILALALLFTAMGVSGCAKTVDTAANRAQKGFIRSTQSEITEAKNLLKVDHLDSTEGALSTANGWTQLFTGEPTFHAIHYRIDLTFPAASLSKPAFDGEVQLTLKPAKENDQLIALDAAGLQVQKVFLLNRFEELKFNQNGEKLEIDLGHAYGTADTLVVSIQYHWDGNKGRGVFFKSRAILGGTDTIYSQSEPEVSKYWFPSNSHPNEKATFESFIHVPTPFVALSNGALSAMIEAGGMRTYHWSMQIPMASYLFVMTAGKFEVHRDTWDGIPIEFYGPSGDMENLAYSLRATSDMLSFFSDKTGLHFPYEKYSQAVVPQYAWGGMEHTTATTLTDRTVHSPAEDGQFSSESLVAHEMAHQWFGDLVTCKSWDHIWLNEGFASYFDALYQESRHGRSPYLKTMVGVSNWFFSEEDQEARPVVFPYYHGSLDEYFDSRAYAKGAWVLHMLRNQLGNEAFFKGIQTYLYRNQGQVVRTEDFRKAMEEASGKNLFTFFDQWLMKPGYPKFLVEWDYDMHTKEVILTVTQTQDRTAPGGVQGEIPLFEGPIQVEVAGKVYTIVLNGKNAPTPGTEIFRLASEKMPNYVRFNSEAGWLAKATVTQTLAEWISQLRESADITARVEASHILAQGKWAGFASSDSQFAGASLALETCARKDADLWVRATCAKDLGDFVQTALSHGTTSRNDLIVTAQKTLFDLLHDSEWSVREATAKTLANLPSHFAAETLAALEASAREDDAVRVSVAAVSSLGTLEDRFSSDDREEAFDFVISQLGRPSFQDKIREVSLESLANFSDSRSLPLAEEYSEPRYAESTRKAAFGLLAAVGSKNKDSRDRARQDLETALADTAYTIRRAAVSSLASLGDPKAIPALEKLMQADPDERIRSAARNAIAALKK